MRVHVLYLSTTVMESGAYVPSSYHVPTTPSPRHPTSDDGSWSTMVTSPSASKPVPGVPFLSALPSPFQSLPTLIRRDLDSRLASPPLCRPPPLSAIPHICARALESVSAQTPFVLMRVLTFLYLRAQLAQHHGWYPHKQTSTRNSRM